MGVDVDYVLNETLKYALIVPGDSTMDCAVKNGTWSAWDEDNTYDEDFDPTTFYIGNDNEFPFNIKHIYFWNTAKLQAWIEANF